MVACIHLHFKHIPCDTEETGEGYKTYMFKTFVSEADGWRIPLFPEP